MAERWMDAARRGQADYVDRIGGSGVSEVFEAMLRHLEEVEREVGNPRAFLPARDALVAGWRLLVDKALPYTPDTPEGAAYRLARVSLVTRARELFADLLNSSPPEDAADAAFRRRGAGNALALQDSFTLAETLQTVAFHFSPDGASRLARIARSASAESPWLAERLEPLIAEADTFGTAYRAYMEPRSAAAAKGRALAEACLGGEPLPA